MRRREFITLIGGVAAWPFGATAQQKLMPTIGLLGSTSADESVRVFGCVACRLAGLGLR
jgi:hypothetical protein